MTKEQRRDKESNAKRHRKKSTERSFLVVREKIVHGLPAFHSLVAVIVTLARRCGQGKVAKKARIPVVLRRLHQCRQLESFCRSGVHELSGM